MEIVAWIFGLGYCLPTGLLLLASMLTFLSHRRFKIRDYCCEDCKSRKVDRGI